MEIKVKVSNKNFGGYEELRTINSSEELDTLVKEMKSFPADRFTTITLSGFDGDGNPYFRQIH